MRSLYQFMRSYCGIIRINRPLCVFVWALCAFIGKMTLFLVGYAHLFRFMRI